MQNDQKEVLLLLCPVKVYSHLYTLLHRADINICIDVNTPLLFNATTTH